MEDVRKKLEGWFKTSTAIVCVLPILEVHAQIHGAVKDDEPGNWPKDFLQAMIKDDWREWITAIKKEIESWHLFDAADEVAHEEWCKVQRSSPWENCSRGKDVGNTSSGKLQWGTC
jgi:hypothetical protein